MVYVIQDEQGNYVADRAFTLTDEGWMYCSFTGKTTGFTHYTNQKTAEDDLKRLQDLNEEYGFGKKFTLEYIDLQTIKKGSYVIKSVSLKAHNHKKLVNASK